VSGNKTLIAEIPDPSAPKLKGFPDLKKNYTDARNFIKENLGDPPSAVTPLGEPVKVKITGIVFFDKVAHGNGHATNGAEIHPVLKISKAH
jgi:hypothetical protein